MRWVVAALLIPALAPLVMADGVSEGVTDSIPVVLGTNAQSAYSAERKPREQIGVLTHIDCIFSHLPYQPKILYQPWRRAQQEVRTGTTDGFFTAMPDPELDEFATLSDPLILQKWYWFTRSDTEFSADPSSMRKGAILGSHQQLWFDLNGDANYITAQDLPQMLKMLYAGRVEVILADRQHFEKAAHSLDIAPQRYHAQFDRYMPLGVYFGKEFITRHPDFLSQFNRHVHLCAPEGFALSEAEQQIIVEKLQPQVDELLSRAALQHALVRRADLGPLSEEVIQRFDIKWRSDYREKNSDALLAMLDASLMAALVPWQAETAVINEVIVIDTQGRNIAAVPFTSDYYQGDEVKFQQGFHQPEKQWFFDEVVYDHSTHRFQVQMSLRLDVAGEPLGVLTLGVDIETILHNSEQ
ncbi:hypothetical protein [Gilvimarinus sp. DA14]|uniref:transporter substrate-binding domain-containing protein n=1 Tax=Gilvimarinus sp. DA14 TaxID=2956798 RepID=UPI0020B85A5C|nr:hypothetical protein [Gilvimarinus sp. DA14]UTF61732.1 hypothetical protein NHM04_08055 [Gilvimarinus sp. DA14]